MMQTTKNIFQLKQTSYFKVWRQLSKINLVSMVVFSVYIGFIIAGGTHSLQLLYLLGGTFLCAAGCHMLNQWYECDTDALMERTRNRPLPAKLVSRVTVFLVGSSLCFIGIAILNFSFSIIPTLLCFFTFFIYLYAYTPLKKVSYLNTWVGAISGALPPLIGATTVKNSLDKEIIFLFLLVFFWQIPHFFSLVWKYRKDYQAGGFYMLPLKKNSSKLVGIIMLAHSLALIAVSLLTVLEKKHKIIFFIGTSFINVYFLYYIIMFISKVSDKNAGKVFLASVIYLPLILLCYAFIN